MIDVTDVDLRKFAKAVYALSKPVGLGFLHYREGDLSDADADELVRNSEARGLALSMDYVHGRQCKMTVHRSGDRLYIKDSWFDHTPTDLAALRTIVGF